MLKKLAGQTAVYGLSSIVGRFLNYLLTPLYTYQFMASEYGVVTEMYAYVAFFIIFLTFGMETAYFRFASQSDEPNKAYATSLFPVAVAAGFFMVLCSLFSGDIASWIAYPEHPEYIWWFAIVVGLDAITSLPMARLRFENKAALFAGINISSIIVNVGLNLFFIAYCKVKYDAGETNSIIETCYNPELGVGYIFVINLVSSLFKAVCLLPFLIQLRPSAIDKQMLGRMFSYSLPLLIAGIAGFTNENMDRLLLKYVLIDDLGPELTMRQVGIYGACYKVSILITLFIQAYRYAAEPFFFQRAKEDDSRAVYAQMMRFFVSTCLLIFLAIMLNLDLVMWFVGEEYREGVTIVPILLAANVFLGIFYNLAVWYKLTDTTRFGAYIALIGALITIVGNILLIPILGYVGSAWTTLACYVSMVIISYLMGRRRFPISYPVVELFGLTVLISAAYYLSTFFNWSTETAKIICNNLILLGIVIIFAARLRPKKIIT